MYRPTSHPSRYAERDHEQLVELRVQRDQLEQKLLVEQGRDDGVEYKQGQDDGVEHEQGRDDAGLHKQGRNDADEQATSSSKETSKQAAKRAGKQEEEQQKPSDANMAKQRAMKVNPDLETLQQEQEALNNKTLRLQGLKPTFLNTGTMTPLGAAPSGVAQQCQILLKVQGQNPIPVHVQGTTCKECKIVVPTMYIGLHMTQYHREAFLMMQKGMGELKEQDAEFQIFVEAWIGAAAEKKTIVLKVKSTTTVREVMEMLKKKEGVIPEEKRKLRTRAGKYLLQQDLSLAEYGVGKEATLFTHTHFRPFRHLSIVSSPYLTKLSK